MAAARTRKKNSINVYNDIKKALRVFDTGKRNASGRKPAALIFVDEKDAAARGLFELGQIQPLQLQKRSLYIESSGVSSEASV